MADRKKIQFSFEGVDYTLEFLPWTVRKMEDRGFDVTKIESRIANVGDDLFKGAMIAHHDYVPEKERERIYENLCVEEDGGLNIIQTLSDMLQVELENIVKHPKGNVTWTVV